MANILSCSFLPTASISSLAPKSKSPIKRSSSRSLQIVQRQQLQLQGDHGCSDAAEMHLPPVMCSRREIVGLGAMLAITGVGTAIVSPETNAATGECVELTETPSGLAFCDKSLGSGITASKGLLIKAHYSGRLENGKVFDSSYNRGKPLVFRVGVGEVIRGWDQGILGTEGIPPMLAGGKRTLRIPSQLAYGERGAGCRGGSCLIPPNAVLIFDVEFVGKA